MITLDPRLREALVNEEFEHSRGHHRFKSLYMSPTETLIIFIAGCYIGMVVGDQFGGIGLFSLCVLYYFVCV